MEQFQNKRNTLLEQQTEEKESRRAARVNSHTTLEIDRATNLMVEAVQEGTRHSEAFFATVGGAGSSGDLMVQGQGLIARAKQT